MPIGPRISIVPKLAVKTTLTPSLVQMVNILAMNKLELQEAITQELLENPLLDEAQDDATPTLEELTKLELEVESERRREQSGEGGQAAADGDGRVAGEGDGGMGEAGAAEWGGETGAE
ncbi:MAG: hypothetical protein ACRD1E_07320, partial [Terriglobales bacterium]